MHQHSILLGNETMPNYLLYVKYQNIIPFSFFYQTHPKLKMTSKKIEQNSFIVIVVFFGSSKVKLLLQFCSTHRSGMNINLFMFKK